MKKRLRFPLWAKTLSILLVSVSLVSVVAVIFLSTTMRDATRQNYIERSIEIADAMALYVDVDDVKSLRAKVDAIYQTIPENERVDNNQWDTPEIAAYLAHFKSIEGEPEYNRLFKQLETFHKTNTAKYLYLTYADYVGKNHIYLVDDAPLEERCMPGSFDPFTESDETIYEFPEKGFAPEITDTEQYGNLATVGKPIYDENHEIVAFSFVDLSMDEIVAQENALVARFAIILGSLGAFAVIVGFLLVLFLIIRPIQKLTKVANEYVEGQDENLDKFSKVKIRTGDEIEDLSDSMKKMENDINQHIKDLLSTSKKLKGVEKMADELKFIADVDALTRLGNKRAFLEMEDELDASIKKGGARFAISMIDMNNLKMTNDSFGHEKGDEMIVALSELIKQVFIGFPTFRVGGDEFVVISENDRVDLVESLEERFYNLVCEQNENNPLGVSAAIGTAIYDPSIDHNVEDVLDRADEKMYETKKWMKRY